MTMKKKYEYIVVGSGPGGATLAKELSYQTKSVLIVEYGSRFTKTRIRNVSAASILYDKDKRPVRSELASWSKIHRFRNEAYT